MIFPIFTQSGLMVDGFPWWTCPRSEPGAPSGQGGASCHVFQDWLEFGKALFNYVLLLIVYLYLNFTSFYYIISW
jgi:hypothetical protein